MDQADDLKAFERRMIEIISSLQPSIWRWRLILIVLILITLTTFYTLIITTSFLSSSAASTSSISSSSIANDLKNNKSYFSIFSSNFFRKEVYFSLSFTLLICAFLFGIHRKMFASSIIISRFHSILADYNMSCDSHGRLIVKARPKHNILMENFNNL